MPTYTTIPATSHSTAPPLALYIHWPYCLARCPYCDFNAHVGKHTEIEPRYIDAVIAELSWHRDKIGPRQIQTIFLGGGTPSLMQAKSVERIIDAAENLFGIAPAAEITLEANPTSSSFERFTGYRTAGINRLSLGVQALNDDHLRFLGRQHNAASARSAINDAAKIFDRYSFDLIYARHGEHSITDWQTELSEALQIANGHISAYTLTIEPNTPFAALDEGGLLSRPSLDTQARFLEVTTDLCEAHGYQSYEISNFSYLGQECRHNIAYWRYNEFLGIGAGAHSRWLDLSKGLRTAQSNIKPPLAYMNAVEKKRWPGSETIRTVIKTPTSPRNLAQHHAAYRRVECRSYDTSHPLSNSA